MRGAIQINPPLVPSDTYPTSKWCGEWSTSRLKNKMSKSGFWKCSMRLDGKWRKYQVVSFRNPDGVERGRDKRYRSYHATVTAAAVETSSRFSPHRPTTTHKVSRLAHFHSQQYRQGRSHGGYRDVSLSPKFVSIFANWWSKQSTGRE